MTEPEFFLNENMENEFEKCWKKYSLDDRGFKIAELIKPFYFSLYDKYGNLYYYFDGVNFLYTDNLIIFDQLLTTKYIYCFGERKLIF